MRTRYALLFLVTACSSGPAPNSGTRSSPAVASPTAREIALAPRTEDDDGLRFVLRAGEVTNAARPVQAANTVAPVALDTATAGRLLDRLSPLTTDNKATFQLPQTSRPAPTRRVTVPKPFPAPTSTKPKPDEPTSNAPQPATIIRRAPEGDVALAPQLTATFSRPVAALTDARALNPADVPLMIEPAIEGTWRWLTTETLIFEPQNERFAMATEYSVTTRDEWRGVGGARFEEPVRWRFRTAAPSVVGWHPSGNQVETKVVQALIVDQPVDGDAIRQLLKMSVDGQPFAIRAPSPQELERVQSEGPWAGRHEAARIVAFVARQPLPANADVQLELPSGWRSLEGPRTANRTYRHDFSTYPPLKIARSSCGWRSKCPPMAPFVVQFTNRLDADAIDTTRIRVDPPIERAKIEVTGRAVSIQGRTNGRTAYQVTVPADVRDVYGQQLGRDQSVKFTVGSAEPRLGASGQRLTVQDPAKSDTFSVFTVNYPRLKMKAWRGSPTAWNAVLAAERGRRLPGQKTAKPMPLGPPAINETIKTSNEPDQLVETTIDLKPVLGDEPGHVLIELTPPAEDLKGWRRNNPPVVRRWIQRTRLALQVRVDEEQLLAWVTELATGKPVAGAEVRLDPHGQQATTDAGGLAQFELQGPKGAGSAIVTASLGNDTVFIPEATWYRVATRWSKTEPTPRLRAFIFDDRRMYRPGETAHVKGWIRRETPGPKGDLLALDGDITALEAMVYDAQNVELAKQQIEVSRFGGFNMKFDLPLDANLGAARISFRAPQSKTGEQQWLTHRFEIQAFRRPEFEVEVETDPAPHRVGEYVSATALAKYYAGGPLPNAPVEWQVEASPGRYTPPGHSDYTFGPWTPWWQPVRRAIVGPNAGQTTVRKFEGLTNAFGQDVLRIDLLGLEPPQPTSVSIRAAISDVNRQAWAGEKTLLVHPGDLYVGIRSEQGFGAVDEPIVVSGIVVDIDGQVIAGRTVTATMARLTWKRTGSNWNEVETNPIPCQAKSDSDGRLACRYTPPEGGRYRLTAQVRDDRGRPNVTSRTFWVFGRQGAPDRGLDADRVTLVPDKAKYNPGDSARILVQAPFANAEGLLTVEREGIAFTQRFRIDGVSHVLQVPIEARYLPSVSVSVELVGQAPRDGASGLMRPAFASGQATLPVDDRHRRLIVEATPAATSVAPGAKTSMAIRVVDAEGRPVTDAEVAVVVVDEAILALTDANTPDPLPAFYPPRSAGVRLLRTRDRVVLTDPDVLADAGVPAPTAASTRDYSASIAFQKQEAIAVSGSRVRRSAPGESNAAPEAIVVRKDFSALAAFVPAVRTGPNGRARVDFKLPDSLTRYRIMAVAADATRRFGSGEATITARKILMVRPSPPRFMNFGDVAEIPVVIQNQGSKPVDVDLAIRGTLVKLTGQQAFRITVPNGDRAEVRFGVSTTDVGQATFQVAASAENMTDAAEFSLPIYTPATTEAFATYGNITRRSVRQAIAKPTDVFDAFGGLEVTTASTELQALTDAFLYLQRYPFECAEQLSSRIISVVALKDVLQAFKAKDLPAPEQIVQAMQRDIEALATRQTWDGGWGFWSTRGKSWPFVSVHAMHALTRAQEKGYKVPKRTMTHGQSYLRRIDDRLPKDYPPKVRQSVKAYALYVRAMMGELDEKAAITLIREAGGINKMPLEMAGWLYPVLADGNGTRSLVSRLRRRLNNAAAQTAREAHFVTSYSEGAHLVLHSEHRVDALLLEGILRDRPRDPLVPKLVRGLLSHRKRGRWSSTQENTWVLLALDRYFRAYERVTPNFVARIWLGDRFAGEHAYRGRTTEQHQWFIPMAELTSSPDILLAKAGAGRMYYRLGLRYAPKNLDLEPLDRGFSVVRRYEAIDDPADVHQDKDGTWRVRAGALVRVRLNMIADGRRYHVALVDALPAGLEPLNPALAVSQDVPSDTESESAAALPIWLRHRPWFEHQNMKDARVEAFASSISGGIYRYDYVARATTPGRYVVPPAKAEQMYAPETFGRSGSDRLVVK